MQLPNYRVHMVIFALLCIFAVCVLKWNLPVLSDARRTVHFVRSDATLTVYTYLGVVCRFVRKRRAAIKIQTWWRGVRARELVKALKIKRKKMLEARLRKEKAERERMMKEKGESLMEDSFMAAQKELYAMAKDAESKASLAARGGAGGDVNLDSMFTMLADDTSKSDADLKRVEADLDALLSTSTPGGTVSIRRGDGTRTIRRKRRIQKKVEEVCCKTLPAAAVATILAC
eukprot:m.1288823 g.1288823  ORF g.1288823 m.1288823 type:complete len:231 (-) comp24782_c0_seq16:3976-4668(-)